MGLLQLLYKMQTALLPAANAAFEGDLIILTL